MVSDMTLEHAPMESGTRRWRIMISMCNAIISMCGVVILYCSLTGTGFIPSMGGGGGGGVALFNQVSLKMVLKTWQLWYPP